MQDDHGSVGSGLTPLVPSPSLANEPATPLGGGEVSATRQIVIDFPKGIELPCGAERELVGFVEHLCKHYERGNPGRVMWAFGIGAYPVHIPMTDDDPRPMEFDDTVFHIEVSEREAYDWPCATCGLEQEQHELLGNTDCAFVPADRLAYLAHRKAVRQARREGVATTPTADGEASKPKARATEPKSSTPSNHTEESKP